MVNGLLAGGASPVHVTATIPELLKLEDAIDKALIAPTGASLDEELSVIQQEEPIDVSDLPF